MNLVALILGATLAVWGNPDCPEDCVLTATPASTEMRIDGQLNEPAWMSAAIATDFTQYSPNEGKPATQRTEVRVLYGQDALFISAFMYDSNPQEIRRTLGRRDEYTQADWFIAAIDSYFDRKTAYNFAVSASGVQADGINTGSRFSRGGGGFDFDRSWDAVWYSAVGHTDEGWTVEMRIPYSMLRFSDAREQRWGINFRRVIPRLSEIDDWVLIPRAERSSGTVAQYGLLEGIVDIDSHRNIQITPYTVSSLRSEEGEVAGQSVRFTNADVGGDLKLGLSPNITLDATINPDFGQVDADPAELNLTAFESFFRERRPFFTEGVQIFNYELDRGGSLLYTRRIGSRAPIVGAAKLSGRTGGGTAFGFFGAASGDNFNPANNYGVGRVQQQIGTISNVGGMATFYDGEGEHRSLAGGMDWDLRFGDNRYRFDGQVSGTRRSVSGDIAQGFALAAGFDRQRSIWNLGAGVTVVSDGFNPNDVGRLRQNNYINISGGTSHQINRGEPFGPFQRASAFLYMGSGYSYREGLHNGMGFFFNSDWTTKGFQEIELGMRSDYLVGGYDVTETRGLGPRARPRELNVELGFSTDSRRTWELEPAVEVDFFGDGGRGYAGSLEGEWTTTSRLSLSLEVGLDREQNVTEWAANEAFAPSGSGWLISESSRTEPADVDVWYTVAADPNLNSALSSRTPWNDQGHHYLPVFGQRDTRAADITLRSSITLTRTLAIQFYGQLFAARGSYHNFSLLQDRDTLVPIASFPKQYDFAFSNFQTNTVLRWEYQPGSTLFVVWTQSRSGSDELSQFDLVTRSPYDQATGRQLTDTFELFPTNIFLVKFSYKFLR